MNDRIFRLIKSGTHQQMVCFHHAGGTAEYFMPWKNGIADDTAIYAVQLPGHGSRIQEPLLHDLHQMADQIAAACSFLPARPTVFFGHSMGAALAFEVALRMQRQGKSIAGLYVSGRLPPHKNTGTDFYRQSEETLLNKIISLQGADMDYRQPELKSLLVPIFRADFAAIETYQRRCEQRLNCPVIACIGEADSEVSVSDFRQWCQISSGTFELNVFSGGHFYLNDQRESLFDFLNQCLANKNQPVMNV
ncbi:thioesterase II family protein [Xenorhabdus sp. XENO-1]|uniref:thioesterase II family protein n=1 Tax=Xenorhabdus bovienii TaxID=40576 RepID=UPI0020CA5911|nr:thioesterase II family protein [Xenorhabdus bovienii]MCP9267475.1 thioesterase II family protein [Xenorhabdus bovienii subsp. africana]